MLLGYRYVSSRQLRTCRGKSLLLLSAMCGRPRVGKENLHDAGWSVQPCVRPLDAVHMTAGHNALRGSGPGQKPAFDNALAHVGCPDRRIDRLCITCCSPSQPSHRAECRRDLVTPPVRRVPCSTHLWPSSPKPSGRSCWRAQLPRPLSGVAPTMRRARAGAWSRGFWHSGSPRARQS